jgi:hypothetical protein
MRKSEIGALFAKTFLRGAVLLSATGFIGTNLANAELFIVVGDHCPQGMTAASGCSAAGLSTNGQGVCCSDGAITLQEPKVKAQNKARKAKTTKKD